MNEGTAKLLTKSTRFLASAEALRKL